MSVNNRLWLTILFSIGIWLFASVFFIIALYFVMWLYQRLDTTKYAVIKLGICGTAIGLTLDSYILYNSSNIFSQLSSQQIMSFTIWMVIAYALYLIIPFVMERKRLL